MIASFTFILSGPILLLKCVHIVFVASSYFSESFDLFRRLAACGLALVSWFVEAWRLQLLAIDQDPGSKLGPSIAHDLELSCDAQQLTRARVCYVYCEFFSQVTPYIL